MEKKFPNSPITWTFVTAAVLALLTAIFLIFNNPSRFPQNSPAITSPTSIPTEIISTSQTNTQGKQKTVRLAKEDLARRLNLPLDATTMEQIVVVSAEEVTWPDTSLGCPQPGRMYTQILTPGYKIVLREEGKSYSYHASTLEQVFLCKL